MTTENLTVTCSPAQPYNRGIRTSSSNTAVATVSGTATMTAGQTNSVFVVTKGTSTTIDETSTITAVMNGQTRTVVASIAGTSLTANVSNVLAGANVSASPYALVPVTITIEETVSELAVSGKTVSLTSNNVNATIATVNAVTDVNGQAFFNVSFPLAQAPATVTFTATASGNITWSPDNVVINFVKLGDFLFQGGTTRFYAASWDGTLNAQNLGIATLTGFVARSDGASWIKYTTSISTGTFTRVFIGANVIGAGTTYNLSDYAPNFLIDAPDGSNIVVYNNNISDNAAPVGQLYNVTSGALTSTFPNDSTVLQFNSPWPFVRYGNIVAGFATNALNEKYLFINNLSSGVTTQSASFFAQGLTSRSAVAGTGNPDAIWVIMSNLATPSAISIAKFTWAGVLVSDTLITTSLPTINNIYNCVADETRLMLFGANGATAKTCKILLSDLTVTDYSSTINILSNFTGRPVLTAKTF